MNRLFIAILIILSIALTLLPTADAGKLNESFDQGAVRKDNPVDANGNSLATVNYVVEYVDDTVEQAQSVGGQLLYYHTLAVSDVAGVYRLATSSAIADSNFVVNGISTLTLIGSWITPIGEPGIATLPAGIYSADCYLVKSTGKDLGVSFELYKRTSGGVETFIASSTTTQVTTTITRKSMILALDEAVSLINGSEDRLVLKFYANPSGMGTNPDLTFYVGGSRLSLFGVPGSQETFARVSLSNISSKTVALSNLGIPFHDAIQVDSLGNVAIGTTPGPGYKLNVPGNVRAGANFWADGSLLSVKLQPRYSGQPVLVQTYGGSDIARFHDNLGASFSGIIDASGTITSKLGNFRTEAESTGFIADAAGNSRIGLMKYPGQEGAFTRGNNVTLRFGRYAVGNIAAPGYSFTPEMVIYGNGYGYVGIGTTTPQVPLSVVGATNVSGDLTVGSSFLLNTSGTNRWVMTGDALYSDQANGGAYIFRRASSATLPTYAFRDDGDSGIGRAGADSLAFITNGVNRATIDNLQMSLSGNLSVTGLINGASQVASVSAIPNNASFAFNLLSDAPSRAGQGGKVLAVNVGETGYEWVSAGAGAGDMLSTNNLSDVANVPTSRFNLGLGSMAIQNATDVSITGGTVAESVIPAEIARDTELPLNASFTFNGLSDAPSRAGQAGKALAVNMGENGYEWITVGGGSGDMLSTNNLSDVADVPTSRFNLGLGSMATQNATDVSITGGLVHGASQVASESALNAHTGSSEGIHGLPAGVAVVGATNSQTISNKTIDGTNSISGTSVNSGIVGEPYISSLIARDTELPLNASFTFNGLSDVPTRVGQAGKVLAVNGGETGYEWITAGGGGATTFLQLTDTPSAYTGQASKTIRVNVAENALEFVNTVGLPSFTNKNGANLRVNDTATDVDWVEARDTIATWSMFTVPLATDSKVLLSSYATPAYGDVWMVQGRTERWMDRIYLGLPASSAAELQSGGIALVEHQHFTFRVGTSTFDAAITSNADRPATLTITLFKRVIP